MYVLKPGIKRDPVRRWALPDRIFFGYGSGHILAGVYLQRPPLTGFYAERIIPIDELPSGHMYVTDGDVAFDYHGYSKRPRLLEHHRKGWTQRYPGWDCTIAGIDFPLLDTAALHARKMRGPDQYLFDPIPRARRFIERIITLRLRVPVDKSRRT